MKNRIFYGKMNIIKRVVRHCNNPKFLNRTNEPIRWPNNRKSGNLLAGRMCLSVDGQQKNRTLEGEDKKLRAYSFPFLIFVEDEIKNINM